MGRRKNPAEGNPRTGTGDAPRGRKPRNSELRIEAKEGMAAHSDNRYRGPQPRGWGLGKVIDIFTRKEK